MEKRQIRDPDLEKLGDLKLKFKYVNIEPLPLDPPEGCPEELRKAYEHYKDILKKRAEYSQIPTGRSFGGVVAIINN